MTEKNGSNKLGLWASVAIAGVAIFAGLGSLYYNSFQTKANSDSIIKLEISQHESEMRENELKSKILAQQLKSIEVETQFCGVARDINRMHANDMRNTAMLWHKIYGETFPTDNAYYPEYGRCNSTTEKQN